MRRRSLLAAGAGLSAAVAGCSSVDSLLGSGDDAGGPPYERWIPAPRAPFRPQHYSYGDASALREHADHLSGDVATDPAGLVRPALVPTAASSLRWALGNGRRSLAVARLESPPGETVFEGFATRVRDQVGDHQARTDSAATDRLALERGRAREWELGTLGSQFLLAVRGATAVSLVDDGGPGVRARFEALVGAEGVPAYAEVDPAAASLLRSLAGGHYVSVSPLHEPLSAEDARPEVGEFAGLRGSGTATSFDDETATVRTVLSFESEDDVDLNAVEASVEFSTHEHLEDGHLRDLFDEFDYWQSGRTVVFEGSLPTAAWSPGLTWSSLRRH